MRRRAAGLAVVAAALVALIAAPVRAVAAAAPATPQLYYTTNYPPQLKVASYRAAGDEIQVGTPRLVTKLPAADGLAYLADGTFLVGGSKTGNVYKVNPDTGAYTTQPSGIPTAFHVTVAPDGSTAWTAGLPGQLASVPLKPFGPGHAANLKGDDQAVTTIGFSPAGTFYTSSTSYGSGSFGTVNLTSLVTKRTLADQRGAHGFTYDAFTKDVFLVGSYLIVQIDPTHPDAVVSERVFPSMSFDQAISDGQGHLLAASNSGDVVLVDFSATSQVGSKSTVVSRAFLDSNLDDIATRGPLTLSATSTTAATSGGSGSKTTKLVVLIGLVVLLVGGFLAFRARQPKQD